MKKNEGDQVSFSSLYSGRRETRRVEKTSSRRGADRGVGKERKKGERTNSADGVLEERERGVGRERKEGWEGERIFFFPFLVLSFLDSVYEESRGQTVQTTSSRR